MRVKDPEVLFALCKSPLKETSFVHLQYVDLETVSNLQWCIKAVSISFRGNRLRRPGESIGLCRQLWTLDLSRNQISTLTDLKSFQALGFLDLSHNLLSYEQIASLRDIHILYLVLEGNPALEHDCTPRQYRLNVAYLLPHVWVLDNRLIGHCERADAEAFVSPHVRSLAAMHNDGRMGGTQAGGAEFLRLPGPYQSGEEARQLTRSGSLAWEFLSLLSGQPTAGAPRDAFRLQHLAHLHDQQARRHNSFVAQQVSGLRSPRWPLLRLDVLLRLPPRLRLDVCVLLAAVLDGPTPLVLVQEVLSILCALHKDKDKIDVDADVACQWPTLPAYAIQALVHHVREEARREAQRGERGYGTVEQGLLEALGGVLRGKSSQDSAAALERHDAGAGLLARHAVLLLSHTPSCPPLTLKPTSLPSQRAYDALLPLLRRAGMSSDDLFGLEDAKGTHPAARWRYGLGSPRAGVGSLPWNKAPPSRPYTRPWSSEATARPQPSPTVRDDARPTPPPEPEPPAFHVPLVSLARRGLLSPGVGHWVQMRRDVYSVVLRVSEEAEAATATATAQGPPAQGPPQVLVQVADFDGFRAPPFHGCTTLRRDELLWDPRGWWCHTLVLQEAARQSQLRAPQMGRACVAHPAPQHATTQADHRTAGSKASLLTGQGSKVSGQGSLDCQDTLGTRPPVPLAVVPPVPAPPPSLVSPTRSGSAHVTWTGEGQGGWEERRDPESAWMDLQRQMGSFRRANRGGAVEDGPVDMQHIRELLRLRRAALSQADVFRLTAVGLEAAGQGKGGQGDGEGEGWEEEGRVGSPGRRRGPRGGGARGPKGHDAEAKDRVRRGDERQQPGRNWFALPGGSPLVVGAAAGDPRPATQCMLAEGEAPPRVLRRKVELALLTRLTPPKDIRPRNLIRPLEPAFKPLPHPMLARAGACRRAPGPCDSPSSPRGPVLGLLAQDPWDHVPVPAHATTATYFPYTSTPNGDAAKGGRWLSSGGLLEGTHAVPPCPIAPSPVSCLLDGREAVPSQGQGGGASVAPSLSLSLSLSQGPSLCPTAATRRSGSSSSVLSQGIVGSPLHSVPSVRANGKPVMTLAADVVGPSDRDRDRGAAEATRFGIVCLVPRQPATVPRSPERRAVAQEATVCLFE